jgi:hypothetical protein
MMKTALVFLLLSCGTALSQEPSPGGSETSQQEQAKPAKSDQPATAEQKASPPPPIIVHVEPAKKTEAEAEDDRRERKEKTDLDRRLVDLTAELSTYTGGLYFATVVLAIATIVLCIATIGLVVMAIVQSRDMKASLALTEIAARAAELSAESAHGLALPIIGADSPDLLDIDGPVPTGEPYGGSDVTGLPGKFSAIPAINFRNEGQTPAFPVKVVVEWRVGASTSDGDARFKSYEYSSQIISKGGEWEAEIHYGIEITETEQALLRQKGRFLWLRVTLFYRDFLKKERAAIFRWRWDNPGGGMHFFESDGTPDTQYQQGDETA